jgi:hypothetical protein
MNNQIEKYFILNNLVGTKITINYNEQDSYDFDSIPNDIIYCNIICNDYTKLTYILDKISFKLLNGAIILFDKWYYNIHNRDKNKRDVVIEWIKENNCELLNFNIDNSFPQESFIFRKKPFTYYWSDG